MIERAPTTAPARGLAPWLQTAWLTRGASARLLLPLAWLYGAITGIDRWLYRVGARRGVAVRAPVVVVGNLIAGGAGKTPTVIAVVAALRAAGYTPGVVSRGYGGAAGIDVLEVTSRVSAAQSGDEPLLIHLRTRAPVVIGRERVQAAELLLQRHPDVDVIVSDDGLQHLRMKRTAEIIVFDERGAGNGWLLPAGPLREPLPAAVPARALVLYNAPSPSTVLPGSVARRRLAGVVELAAWWRGEPATLAALQSLRGSQVLAVAGLANPARFFGMLRECGLDVQTLALPDHHPYESMPWPPATGHVLLTEKDAIKLDPSRVGETRIWVAPLDFELEPAFVSHLLALLPPPGKRHGNTPP